ncbi:class I SAM-dependent methyltransferase [Rhodomicrobium sp. Az07]|uniref:class I SAM-dependent methyltransferase n=1 Tax=Rhodomicrobium sp. Az07 TaxID=2839034 RepID=UPI001BE6B61D|nr:class I SAM-dependent methyltransferase [Rhodomicrobium sp. Az07]MBT3069673.1 class I SAM-dependent methyltransferase [Rhodomicrobium sp. Az07]
MRSSRNLLKSAFSTVFRAGQNLGFDVLPRHFYSEIPHISKLRRADHWKKPFSMIGVRGKEIDTQLSFVRETIPSQLREQLSAGAIYKHACERNGEPGFGEIEALFLYAFICTHQPARIIQIGCGVSTAVCLAAAAFAGYKPDIICIEPYPNKFLTSAAAEGGITLKPVPVETLDLGFLAFLRKNDLFFVDSTHTLGPAGEVSRIVLEMLPRLPEGAFVHFHDVMFPYDYAGNILNGDLFFWHESVLLHAFLAFNERFSILASLSMLHYAASDELKAIIKLYSPQKRDEGLSISDGHFPSSIYLKVN